jgi:hypothetical protein
MRVLHLVSQWCPNAPVEVPQLADLRTASAGEA